MQPTETDGRYVGSVTSASPGEWRVRFTGVTPAATVETVEIVSEPTPTTVTPTSETGDHYADDRDPGPDRLA